MKKKPEEIEEKKEQMFEKSEKKKLKQFNEWLEKSKSKALPYFLWFSYKHLVTC